MTEEKHSCADCSVIRCNGKEKGPYPPFCLTESLPEEFVEKALARYDEDDNRRMMQVAAEVECDGYLHWPRLEETIEFARRMDYKRIGIATCVGLIQETRTLAKVLRSHGFEVFGVACKVGSIPKLDLGIAERCTEIGTRSCNPILQAEVLNHEKTELNIIVGLCVGHDALFNKHSQAPVTTLVAKDRVTGHNPVGVLYTIDSNFSYLLKKEK